MKIRQRLRISNLLMVVVPVVVSALAAALVAFVAWNVVSRTSGIWADDTEDFFRASGIASEAVVQVIADGGADQLQDSETVARMLDTSGLSLVVSNDNGVTYSHGTVSASDRELLDAAVSMGGEVEISSGGRCLMVKQIEESGTTWRIAILGSTSQTSGAATKTAFVLAAVVIAVVLIATVIITNLFLSRFVLRHVTDPLDLLAEGTRQISDGNLTYRLPEDRDDEFAPVFSDFNAMAERLADSVELKRRQERRRSELVTGLSHDLRSPLTSIQAYTEGLLDGVASTPERQHDYAERILAKSHEMAGLVRHLSDVARAERTVEAGELATCQLDDVVRGWLTENATGYDLRGAHVTWDLQPAEARADKDLVSRMLSNLLDNCVRYAERDGSCRVRMTCGTNTEGSWLAVDDDGPGVPEGTEARLFDLFYRGDEARTSTADGNGIGLAVVSLGMERMGGSAIASRSELGGLRVELRFPPEDAPAADTGEEKD